MELYEVRNTGISFQERGYTKIANVIACHFAIVGSATQTERGVRVRGHAVEENSERMLILSSTETYLLHQLRSDSCCVGSMVSW